MDGLSVLNLALGPDTGGQGIRIKQAFDAHAPGWTYRSVVSTPNYMRYPMDQRYKRGIVKLLYQAADVVHLRNRLDAHAMYDAGQGKPTVLHHHGSHFRKNHESLANEARRLGAVQMVSTLDLELLEPDVAWLPAPFDLAALRAIRDAAGPHPKDTIRIAHAPTNRAIKGTDIIEAAVEQLQRDRYRVVLDVIERRTWVECLQRKARADIYIDQLALGYGCNAIEAWGMGLPVLAGVADPTVERHMRATWGGLPFVAVTPDTLASELVRLIESPAARDEWGARGYAHVERWHDDRRVIGQLQQVYASAPRTKATAQVGRSVRYTQRRDRRAAVA